MPQANSIHSQYENSQTIPIAPSYDGVIAMQIKGVYAGIAELTDRIERLQNKLSPATRNAEPQKTAGASLHDSGSAPLTKDLVNIQGQIDGLRERVHAMTELLEL